MWNQIYDPLNSKALSTFLANRQANDAAGGIGAITKAIRSAIQSVVPPRLTDSW